MEREELIILYTQDQRIAVTYPDMQRQVTPDVVRHVGLPGSRGGAILYSHLTQDNVDRVIREQVEYFQGLGQDFEWKYYDYDSPPDLKERLVAAGFQAGEAEAVLALDVQKAPAILRQPVVQDVRQISDPELIEDVMSVQHQVWHEEFLGLRKYLVDTLRQYPQQMCIYVAYVDEVPACSAWVFFPSESQFAGLWGGSTLEAYRKRGLYTALLAVRLQEAARREVPFLTVDASPMSRPILEKYGFQFLANSYPFEWQVKQDEHSLN